MLEAQDGEAVLEIGFGTGYCLVEIAKEVGDEGKVYGIELSEKMQRVSEKKLKRENLRESVHFCLGDAVKLPYENSSLDAVFMSFGLSFLIRMRFLWFWQNARGC